MSDIDRLLQDAAGAGRAAARPAGPEEIRAVGARMRRVRAATATTLSALAVTGLVALVQTTTTPEAALDFADHPTVSPPVTADPDASPVPTLPLEDYLLPTDVVQAAYGADGSLTWGTGQGDYPSSCQPTGSASAVESASRRFVADAEWSVVHQTAETYESSAGAAAQLTDLRAFFGQCATSSETVDLFWAFTVDGVGDAGFVVLMTEPDPSPTLDRYVVVRAAQTGPAVTWVVQSYLGNEYNSRPGMELLAPAVDLLCEPLGSTCAGDPVLTQSYPDADGEVVPGLITVDDVNTSIAGRWRASAGIEPDPGTPNVACSPATLLDAGAGDLAVRAFFDEDDEASPPLTGLTQTRGTFESTTAATAYVDQQLGGWDTCEGGAVDPVQLAGGVPAWRIDFGDVQRYYGFVQSGPHVAVLEWSALSADDSTYGALSDVAARRLSELG